MPIKTLSVEGNPGLEYKVLDVDGKIFPRSLDEDNIRNIPNLRIRDDDVLICGYMRAGTHWMFEILNMLLRGNTDTVPDQKESLHLEHDASIGKIDDYPSPRVLSSHLLFEELPRDVVVKKTKLVYLIRDPRDSLASWRTCSINMLKSKIEGFPLAEWMQMINDGKLEWGSWFQNIKSWEKATAEYPNHPVHMVFYEDLLKDPVGEMIRLKDFLGLERSIEFCRQVANKTQLENMKVDKKKYTEIFDGVTVHYQKGKVGSWRSVFTQDILADFNRRYEAEMEGSSFKDRYMCV